MIDFLEYESNKDAPAILVNSVGGVYRTAEHQVQVVFVVQLHDPETGLAFKKAVSLTWDEKDWLATRQLFAFAMAEWERTKKADGGGRKRVMQAAMN